MSLIQRDPDDNRTLTQVAAAIGSELIHRVTGSCSAFCDESNCTEPGDEDDEPTARA